MGTRGLNQNVGDKQNCKVFLPNITPRFPHNRSERKYLCEWLGLNRIYQR